MPKNKTRRKTLLIVFAIILIVVFLIPVIGTIFLH
ncbi:hypothetical protein Calag_0650 [Caldisphaera lagunensis DSM 15908]|uniref:Uncharacterized protein n=1 Tax=Caldisphaera lagunensis (strain DSM 15908 / JCM 11604 / ANMR 0165 / IC-154) TaxID=1056495 RepID=L0AB83_CALLD|nr:hypothetical protein Calag_0650 [Caldisphaera lagunensis DSM 15908]